MSFYHLNPSRRGERMARRIEQLDDYRVLRRLPRPDEMWCRSMPVSNNEIRLAIVDCETTGLDPKRNKMIEFAVGMLTIDAEMGDVIDVTPPQSWLEDPAEDLPIEIERLTHITSEMLIGKWFPEAAIMKAMAGITAVVAHNAKFDRGFATKRFPALSSPPWICSMDEVDWPALGFTGGRGINALLTEAGFFLPDAHRAAADVWATTCLLASTAPDGRAIAAQMVETARRQSERLYATRAPFECKDMLKAAGYRWSPERRAWWIEGDPERIANEHSWLKGLAGSIRPLTERIDWFVRHR
ncbi:3'-5' exonuclease [Sphingomonas sp.]|uniref:3'-5' exonuclease n=1 Tax=Sphingomonas sp. TaxID=28214 RepID=UPI003B0018C6